MKLPLLKLTITCATLLTSASLAAQVQALEVVVSDQGVISIYQDQVLGDSTIAQRGNTQADQNRPTPTQIPSRPNQSIEFRRNAEAVQIEVVQDLPTSVRMPNGEEAQRSQNLQRFESNRLQTSLPAARKDGMPVEGTRLVAGQQPESAYLQQVREERATRTQEMIELRKAGQDKMQSESAQKIREMRIRDGIEMPEEADFELQSRDTMARLRNSAVSFNPETNSISIVTPSGQTKELNHLPDQAIERFKENVLIADENALEIIPGDDGSIYYRTLSERPVRVFGFIPRQIQTELLLDDETGEVTERVVGDTSLFSQFLNAVSF